jgi:hypothetical protein
MLRLIAPICTVALTTLAHSASAQTVSQTANYEEFTKQFCAADRGGQHVFVLPLAVFDEQNSVTCKNGDSKLRAAEPKDDPGHLVLNIDPPHGSKQSFDCDGKADIDMTIVAINCLPVSQETKEHHKD